MRVDEVGYRILPTHKLPTSKYHRASIRDNLDSKAEDANANMDKKLP